MVREASILMLQFLGIKNILTGGGEKVDDASDNLLEAIIINGNSGKVHNSKEIEREIFKGT